MLVLVFAAVFLPVFFAALAGAFRDAFPATFAGLFPGAFRATFPVTGRAATFFFTVFRADFFEAEGTAGPEAAPLPESTPRN
jgi:hypothetical protein